MEKGTIDRSSTSNCIAMAVYEAVFIAFIMAGMNSNNAFQPGTLKSNDSPYLLQVPLFYFVGFLACHKISGGHLNPAITVAVFFAEWDFKNNLKPMAFMLTGQFLGGLLGVLFSFLFMHTSDGYLIKPYPPSNLFIYDELIDDSFNVYGQAIYMDTLCAFFLCLVFVSMKADPTLITDVPFAQALIYMFSVLIMFRCSNSFGQGSLNPAVSLGQTIYYAGYFNSKDQSPSQREFYNDNIAYLWVWIIFPIIGGVLAGVFAHFVHFPITRKAQSS